MNKSKKNIKVILAAFMAFAFVCASGFSSASSIGAASAEAGAADKDKPQNGNYYFTDFDTAEDAYEAGDKLNKDIISEGVTLLKNENSLPLKTGAKVSVFGKRSVNLRYGGSGSGAGSSGEKITLQQSLERAGLSVNSALTGFYSNDSQSGTAGGNLSSYGVYAGPSGGIGETPVSKIQQYVDESTYNEYDDAAIIVISRAGGEAGDATKGMSTGYGSDGKLNGKAVNGARNYDDHYLQLDQNETDLIKYVGDRFENVIVLLNTGSQMEVGFLDDENHYAYHENIKGALWIGYPGNGNGLEAVGEILTGKINPSGHTVDTYARDFKLDPTWANMATYTNNLFDYSNLDRQFVTYSEGIYSGYRYYETRGFTEGDKPYTGEIHGTTTTEWDNWYQANVVYPFGYGLSYTTFEWEIKGTSLDDGGVIAADGTVSIDVEVTNTGDVAGKDVVQLYYTAPYTDKGIEKAHVILGDYVKTDTLDPGDSQVVTLSVSAQDMASYDYSDANGNGFKGYELESGNYGIKISRNAHDVVFEKTYVVEGDGYKYELSESGTKVENRFDDASLDGTVYLSRSDWEGTWPQEPSDEDRVAPQWVIDAVNNTSDSNAILENDTPSQPYYEDEMPVTGANNGVKLEELYGLDYDDPLWGLFLDQLEVGNKNTKGTMANAIWVSGWTSYGNSELGIPDFTHEDGPSGINGRYVPGNYTNFACETVTASTWNRQLAYEKGLIIGNQGLFGSGTQQVNALYAPACNIHRTPFGGRNFEYFSEDALLSGEMAGNIVKGCNEKGMVTFVKHFAVNDQESCRDSCLTWANEQTIREIYLKSFQICVEKYNSHGMMSALNNVGAVWSGGNYALLTQVLREEWDFEGVVITDYVQNRGKLNGNMAIRAGGDILLATSGSVQNPVGLDKPTTVANMRRAVHNLYYTIVNFSAAFNQSTMNVMGSFEAQTLAPVIEATPYEQSIANVVLNNGEDADNVKYSLKEGSSLPEGLTLSEDGVISGTAELQDEACTFTVVASYGYARREATFTLIVADKSKSVIYIKEKDSIDGYLSSGINEKIDWAYTLDGKIHDITYSLAEGSILPEGITLSSDGTLSGKPKIPFSDYTISVKAESEGMLPMTVRLTLNMYRDFSFSVTELEDAKFGAQYVASIAGAEDDGITYSLKKGESLPQGLTLTENGTIVGVPQETGLKTFTVVASGNNYKTIEQTFTLNIGISYSSVEIGDATVGSEYETYVNSAKGANDVVYTLTGGELPRGMTLSSDGKLSGIPQESGNFTFTITAKSATSSDSAEIVLHVDDAQSNAAYVAGLTIGIVGLVVVVAGCLVWIFVIDRRNFKKSEKEEPQAIENVSEEVPENNVTSDNNEQPVAKKKASKIKFNKSFLKIATPLVCIMMVTVISLGVAFAPALGSGKFGTFVFEAEYVNLDGFNGAGISNSGEGVNNIYGDGLDSDIEKGWSNGYFLGNTYAENSIEFVITSDKAADGQLILRLASELGNLALNNDVFGIEVNGKEIDYSITVTNSAAGSYDFADYPIASVKLAEGENVVRLTIKDNTLKDGNSIGAPLIDCIKIATEAELTWNPLLDNPDKRGEI